MVQKSINVSFGSRLIYMSPDCNRHWYQNDNKRLYLIYENFVFQTNNILTEFPSPCIECGKNIILCCYKNLFGWLHMCVKMRKTNLAYILLPPVKHEEKAQAVRLSSSSPIIKVTPLKHHCFNDQMDPIPVQRHISQTEKAKLHDTGLLVTTFSYCL